MSESLKIAEKQLSEMEKEADKMPPGDNRARCLWICARIKEMIMQATAREENGKDISLNLKNLDEIFKKF